MSQAIMGISMGRGSRRHDSDVGQAGVLVPSPALDLMVSMMHDQLSGTKGDKEESAGGAAAKEDNHSLLRPSGGPHA